MSRKCLPMSKKCLPACDLRCNDVPEFGLECETCPGRNAEKPFFGGEKPRFRYRYKILGKLNTSPWMENEKIRRSESADACRAGITIQFERKHS